VVVKWDVLIVQAQRHKGTEAQRGRGIRLCSASFGATGRVKHYIKKRSLMELDSKKAGTGMTISNKPICCVAVHPQLMKCMKKCVKKVSCCMDQRCSLSRCIGAGIRVVGKGATRDDISGNGFEQRCHSRGNGNPVFKIYKLFAALRGLQFQASGSAGGP